MPEADLPLLLPQSRLQPQIYTMSDILTLVEFSASDATSVSDVTTVKAKLPQIRQCMKVDLMVTCPPWLGVTTGQCGRTDYLIVT